MKVFFCIVLFLLQCLIAYMCYQAWIQMAKISGSLNKLSERIDAFSERFGRLESQIAAPTNSQKSHDIVRELSSLKNEVEQAVTNGRNILSNLNRKIDDLNDKTENQRHEVQKVDSVETIKKESRVVYCRAYRDDLMIECDMSDADYKINLTSVDKGCFFFCGNGEYAIDNQDSVLSCYCDIQIGKNIRGYIETVQHGLVQLQSERKWKVISKSQIVIRTN